MIDMTPTQFHNPAMKLSIGRMAGDEEDGMKMTANRYKVILAILSILVVLLGWLSFHLFRQILSAGFVTYQCEVTRRTVISGQYDEDFAMHQLAWLKGCYAPQKYDPQLRQIVEREYYETVHAVLLYIKSVTGKDLGDDHLVSEVSEWWNMHYLPEPNRPLADRYQRPPILPRPPAKSTPHWGL